MKWLLIFLLVLPSVHAFSCLDLEGDNRVLCEEIQTMNITREEKDYLIASLFSLDYDALFDYNSHITFEEAPSGIFIDNEGYIKDAWMKIITISPSVLLNDTLMIDTIGKIFTDYNYKIDFPRKESGDCKTTYRLNAENVDLSVYQNGNLIGHDSIVSFTAQGNVEFTARAIISITTRVKHYRWDNGECRYFRTEIKRDHLTLNDAVNGQVIDESFNLDFKIIDKHDTTKGTLKADNFKGLELSFRDAQYTYEKYLLQLDYKLLPYYVLIPIAIAQETETSNNIYVERNNEITFSVRNAQDCSIKISSFFHEYVYSCDLSYTEIPLSIITDRQIYNVDDMIKVKVNSDREVKVSYGDAVQYTDSSAEFIAQLYQDKVIAEADTHKEVAFIHVKDKERATLLFGIAIFLFSNYCILQIFRKKCVR